MIYLILSYVIRIWEDDHEILDSNGVASIVEYDANDDVWHNEDEALIVAQEYILSCEEKPTGEEFVDVAVCLTMTANYTYDEWNGDYDVKYELITSDVIIYNQLEDQNNETYLFQ